MVPSIRFKGFSGDWEKKKLSQCVTEVKRVDENSIAPVMMISASGGFINQSERYSFNNAGKSLKKYTLIKKGELAYNHGASKLRPYGSCFTLIDKEQARIPFVYHCFSVNDNNSVYMATLLNSKSVERQLKRIVSSGVRMDGLLNISFDEYTSIPITLPDIEEQSRIADLITKLDNLITLHQRKLDQLKKLKKYFLQNMFPAKGEKVPRIRFKGFTGDWEQRKLKDVYKHIGNAFVGTATPYYAEIGHFYLESNNVKDGQINRNTEVFINDEFYERQKDKWLHTGDIVMVQSGHVGHSAVIPRELNNTAAHALIIFKNPKLKVNPYFLNYQFQTNKSKKKFDNITVGNTIKHILASSMHNFSVDMPSYNEQQEISHYFKRIDNLITLHQRKLELLRNIKKSMLDKMFV